MARPLFRPKEELVTAGNPLLSYPCFGLGLFLLAVGLVVGVGLFVVTNPGLQSLPARLGAFAFLAVPILGLAFFLLWLTWAQIGFQAEIGKAGVRWWHVVRRGWWPWDEVATLWEDGTGSYREGGQGVSWFVLIHRSGARLKLRSDLLTNTREVMARLRKHYIDAKLPAAREAFDAGRPLTFGPVELRPDGLATAAGLLPWAELGGVEVVTGGRLVIRRDEQLLEWFGCPMRRVPDAPLLFALLVELLLRRMPDAPGRVIGRTSDAVKPTDRGAV